MKRTITITIELTFPPNMSQLKLAGANNAIEFITDMFQRNTVKVLEYHSITVAGWTQTDQADD